MLEETIVASLFHGIFIADGGIKLSHLSYVDDAFFLVIGIEKL